MQKSDMGATDSQCILEHEQRCDQDGKSDDVLLVGGGGGRGDLLDHRASRATDFSTDASVCR